ncbi:OmcA/MtrC family decaheme c-type cytochrome [Aquabacterium humicola]|uniref:OmcA/MtrC family decaheme c-type cytochrome n=1 Tax=Aquabacterium humicola TaxID=3237377 RepID=UPI002543249C|nr:OmcA/MtrC family decaheme c-type cytochrome [Rubrivivax pictus]
MFRALSSLLAAAALAAALAGCGGGGGAASPPPADPSLPPTIDTGPAALAAAQSLSIRVDSARFDGKPVIEFTVTNQAGAGMTGLQPADLRFNVAKLVPIGNGEPARWQNYINRASNGLVQGTQERSSSGYAFGSLERLGSGRYRYTFATDIADAAKNPCPAPCTGADGRPLDLRFDPALTHRVTVQQANRSYPEATGVLDLVPSLGAGSGVSLQRDIAASATCNSCHNVLKAHGNRTDTKLCVTCHNGGTSAAGGANIDFKVLVHRIHYNAGGAALPSVRAGTPYTVGGHDYSAVRFTQDVRNCTRCHDGTPGAANATPQGDHWKSQPSIAACGSCHDDVYFGRTPDAKKPYQTRAHSGGVATDNSTCTLCHAAGKFNDAKDVAIAHDYPARLKAAAARFQLNIVSVSGTTPGAKPVVTFSVTDPTAGGAPYDIQADPHFTAAGGASTLAVKIAWTTAEFGNDGSGQAFGQPVTINALTAAAPAGAAGTYTVTSPVTLPVGLTGTLRATLEGHPAGDVTTPGRYTDRLAVKTAFRDTAVTGTVVTRRTVVDVAKCNVCHDVLSLHGNNRSNEIGACTVCHNPNATDGGRRPSANGVLTGGADGKPEESIDFKTMIHGLHAGQADKGGVRDKGLVVYGFGGSVNDFGHVNFPGRLSDCATCHVGETYRLTGAWAAPVGAGLLGTTTSSGTSRTDAADNLRTSPTVAVCASCHDGAVAKLHMQDPANGGRFGATQSALASNTEACTLCHGEGRVFDVKTVHRVK